MAGAVYLIESGQGEGEGGIRIGLDDFIGQLDSEALNFRQQDCQMGISVSAGLLRR